MQNASGTNGFYNSFCNAKKTSHEKSSDTIYKHEHYTKNQHGKSIIQCTMQKIKNKSKQLCSLVTFNQWQTFYDRKNTFLTNDFSDAKIFLFTLKLNVQ